LLGHIEKEVGEPDVEPLKLIDLVENLPSSTVIAPRTISSSLRNLLDEVSGFHGGRVPIHGRLFSQWMHHAYPRECPYPHKSGTTTPLTADEWMTEKGSSAAVGATEMQRHVEELEAHAQTVGAKAAAGLEDKPLMWTAEEELVVSTTPRPSGYRGWLRSILRNAAILAVVVSALASLKHLLASTTPQKSMLPFAGKDHFC